MPSRGTQKSQKHDINHKTNKVSKIAKDFYDLVKNEEEERGKTEGECSPSEVNQFSAAVRPPATIRPSTIMVVTNENFRSVLIKFSPFYSHTKSDIAHFYTLECKNLP
ncbi:hypothetical protein HMPREF0208_02982 [Citrobacter koseri]|nr:hypothetical protein HMPREF0208_02982 [Citrobacter koseri]